MMNSPRNTNGNDVSSSASLLSLSFVSSNASHSASQSHAHTPSSPIAASLTTASNNTSSPTGNNNTNSYIEIAELLPPENFSMVDKGIYRSSFPRTKNIDFLRKLKLKNVCALIPEDYPTAMLDFYKQCNTNLFHCGLTGNKWPHGEIDNASMMMALKYILDPHNHPILIHCNKGKHRTGSLVGCYRAVSGWSLSSIMHEYIVFATPKARLEDQIFIESFITYYIDNCNTIPDDLIIDDAEGDEATVKV